MKTTTRRIASLILAVVMVCSAMGVMAFAREGLEECGECGDVPQSYYTVLYSRDLDRIIECPEHEIHDAEVYVDTYYYYCSLHDNYVGCEYVDVYICLD